jgi:hypothetical protein
MSSAVWTSTFTFTSPSLPLPPSSAAPPPTMHLMFPFGKQYSHHQ